MKKLNSQSGVDEEAQFSRRLLGWRVHHWMWPIVWWARRKPRSHFRQWVWDVAERLDWKFRIWPMYDRIKRERGSS